MLTRAIPDNDLYLYCIDIQYDWLSQLEMGIEPKNSSLGSVRLLLKFGLVRVHLVLQFGFSSGPVSVKVRFGLGSLSQRHCSD